MLSKRDNYCQTSAGLAIGSTTSQYSTARAATVSLNGRAVNCPAVASRAFTAGHASLAAQQVCAIFVLAAADGTYSTQQSAIASASTSGVFEWPNPTAAAVVGAIVIRSGGSAFVPGTTALTSVATYFDNAGDYGRPLTY